MSTRIRIEHFSVIKDHIIFDSDLSVCLQKEDRDIINRENSDLSGENFNPLNGKRKELIIYNKTASNFTGLEENIVIVGFNRIT